MKNNKKYLTKNKFWIKYLQVKILTNNIFYLIIFENMETKNISQRFSLIYGIVSFVFYAYIFFLIVGFWIWIFIIFSQSSHFTFSPNINILYPLWFFIWIVLAFLVLFFIILNIYLLYLLKKISFSLKNWEIFTFENRKNIKKFFIILAILFIISGLIFSGGIISIVAWLFIWILYEIFFIGFDYKLKNEKLEEENNLTI